MKNTTPVEKKKPTRRSGFEGIFSGDKAEEVISEAAEIKEPKKNDNCVRVTLLMDADLHQKIKIMAHWELSTLKEIVNLALEKKVEDYELAHGVLASVPKSKKK